MGPGAGTGGLESEMNQPDGSMRGLLFAAAVTAICLAGAAAAGAQARTAGSCR